MKERLQKILSARGVASRRKAEELIQEGQVTVNGEKAVLGDTADPDRDEILISGQPLPPKQEFVYLLLNKPRGFVTTMSDEKGRPTAVQLVADCGTRVYPVGRLDMDSEGLLLFTNDGDLLHRLISPKKEVPKIYYARHEGQSGPEDVQAFTGGLTLRDGTVCRPAELTPLGPGESLIQVCEGKYHQVRRMMASRGMTVTYLERRQEGSLTLDGLPRGQARELTEVELAALEQGE